MSNKDENSTDDIMSKLLWIESEMIKKQSKLKLQNNSMFVGDDESGYKKKHLKDENPYFDDPNSAGPSSSVYRTSLRQKPKNNVNQSSVSEEAGRNNERRPFYVSDKRQNQVQYGQPNDSSQTEVLSGSIERLPSSMIRSSIQEQRLPNIPENQNWTDDRRQNLEGKNEQHPPIYGGSMRQNQSQLDARPFQSSNDYRSSSIQEAEEKYTPLNFKDYKYDTSQNQTDDQSTNNYKNQSTSRRRNADGSSHSKKPNKRNKNYNESWNSDGYDYSQESNKNNTEFQGKSGAMSRCVDEVIPLAKLIKYTKRLIFTFGEIKDEISSDSKYQGVLNDHIKNVKQFLKNLEKSNGSCEQMSFMLKKYDYYRKTYYCIRDRIDANILIARRNINRCDKSDPNHNCNK